MEPLWWATFGDPLLTDLVSRAVATNLDLRAATARLEQSRAQRGIVAADQFPTLNGNASYTRQRLSERGVVGLFGAGGGSGGSPAGTSNGLGGRQGAPPTSSTGGGGSGAFDLYQYGFDASWELDLFGRVRRAVEGADASLQAAADARRDVALTTVAEVARDYLQLRAVQDALRITRDNLAAAEASARLTAERTRGGLATELDLAQARQQAASTGAELPRLEAQEAQLGNALGLLLALPPNTLHAELAAVRPVPPVPPRVPVGLPSELARRRPDIRQAEAELHAATANIGAAEADFFPRITLSGSIALQGLQLRDLGDFAARTYGFGPSITIPIFQGGRLRANLALREAQQAEAALRYQRTVLTAFRDVDDALTSYAAEQRRRDGLGESATQARRSLSLAQERFRQGLSDYLQVLTAQRAVLSAELQLADSTAAVSADLVALYKALGGGWEVSDPDAGPEPPRRFVGTERLGP